MAKIYGQLEYAQLQGLIADPSSPALGQIWADISTPSAAVPKFFDGTIVRTLSYVGGVAAALITSGTFTTTNITLTLGSLQTHLYVGVTPQVFTGFGTISGLTNGAIIRVMGSSDTNTISMAESDSTDGWLMIGGPFELVRGRSITFEYNSTLERLVEIERSF